MKGGSNEDRDDQFADGVDVDAAAAGLRSDDELVEVIAPQLRDVQLDALDLWVRGERIREKVSDLLVATTKMGQYTFCFFTSPRVWIHTVPFGMIDSLDLVQILTQLCLQLAKSSFFYFGSTRL